MDMRKHVTLRLLLVFTTATSGLAAFITRLPAPPPVSGTFAHPTGTPQFPGQRGWLHHWSPQKPGGTRVVSSRSENVVSVPRVLRQVYFDPLPEYLVSAVPEGQRGSQVPQRQQAVQMQRAPQLSQPTAAAANYDQPTAAAANYEFEYEVKYPPSGVDFGHRESRDGLLTTGRYRVLLPDGRLQVVDYSSNQNGYMANVQYIAQPQPQGKQQQ